MTDTGKSADPAISHIDIIQSVSPVGFVLEIGRIKRSGWIGRNERSGPVRLIGIVEHCRDGKYRKLREDRYSARGRTVGMESLAGIKV